MWVFFSGGPGLHDPCEREPRDVLMHLSAQQADDLTHSAQHALRLIAFGQLYKVLNMDPLPANKASPRLLEGGCQKRPREDSGCEDRDFIKRMKGDLNHQLTGFSSETQKHLRLCRLNQIRPAKGLISVFYGLCDLSDAHQFKTKSSNQKLFWD
ncbi:hypothetical protein AMECASPLE_037740 [Ameca splendens]|uniref:DZF domain-containing protein n=1 Tax=Ameca splendens TaxID=208324 RepID=A0ABV0YJF3_9TELE